MTLMAGLLGGTEDESTSDDEGGGEDRFGGGGEGDLLGDDDLMGGGLGFDDEDEGSDEDDLTYRLDEVEREVDSLVNKVETVRGENEKISESITSVERNVDKLVELYEIVTQGINPFVGDQEIGDAFETAVEGGFGVADEPEDEIDEELSQASAEDFLDDEFDDDTGDDEALFDESALEDEMGDEPILDDESALDDEPMDPDPPLEDEPDAVGSGADASADAVSERSPAGDAGRPSTLEEAVATAENGELGEPPYLVRLPSRADAELATIDWLQFLVDVAGRDGAANTIAYYESIGWISTAVEGYLQSMLQGFGGSMPTDDEPAARSILSGDEHKRSLQYVAWIATPEREPVVFENGHGSEPTTPT